MMATDKRLLRGETFTLPDGREAIFLNTSNSARSGAYPRDIFFVIKSDDRKETMRLDKEHYLKINPFDSPDNYENQSIAFLEGKIKEIDDEIGDFEYDIEDLKREKRQVENTREEIEKILDEKRRHIES
jgi:hypothetical protein